MMNAVSQIVIVFFVTPIWSVRIVIKDTFFFQVNVLKHALKIYLIVFIV